MKLAKEIEFNREEEKEIEKPTMNKTNEGVGRDEGVGEQPRIQWSKVDDGSTLGYVDGALKYRIAVHYYNRRAFKGEALQIVNRQNGSWNYEVVCPTVEDAKALAKQLEAEK